MVEHLSMPFREILSHEQSTSPAGRAMDHFRFFACSNLRQMAPISFGGMKYFFGRRAELVMSPMRKFAIGLQNASRR
jgi:hypothetical protein